jgi:peptide/nickel transport system substrate-binding protein
MRHRVWLWLAASSLMLAAFTARAQIRPQYGGTLHVNMRAAPSSLDPGDRTQPDSFDRRNLTGLLFETLIASDEHWRLRPALAVEWETSPGSQRWKFRLRRDVKFHDGSALTAEIAGASLRTANPAWNVFSEGDAVVIETSAADSELPGELALARNAIVKRNADGTLSGTGPFHIVEWQAGRKLSLAAEESYWGGRPFMDAIEIELGKSFRDQALSLQLGRAELVDVAPEQSHRAPADEKQVANSSPVELVALVFGRDAQSPEEKSLREALALCVERASMRSVLLRGAGEPAASILPDWMSGYGFVFPVDADLVRARHLREQVRTAPGWSLGYDANDPLARLLAERVALNARDAGLAVQPTASATADVRLVRIPLAGADGWISLDEVASVLGLARPQIGGNSAEELYSAERAMLDTNRIIPLFHLPVAYAATTSLKNWKPRPDGGWNLADAWLASGKP